VFQHGISTLSWQPLPAATVTTPDGPEKTSNNSSGIIVVMDTTMEPGLLI
jgi:hypothetical protein